MLHALAHAHLRIFVRFTHIVAERTLLLAHMLELTGLVDVESQIALKLHNLPLSDLHLLEICLSLILQGSVRLHEVIVELDELLHLSQSVPSHVRLVSHLTRSF